MVRLKHFLSPSVIPTKVGIQAYLFTRGEMDSCFYRNDIRDINHKVPTNLNLSLF